MAKNETTTPAEDQPAEELTNSHPGWYTDGLTDEEYAAGKRREEPAAEQLELEQPAED